MEVSGHGGDSLGWTLRNATGGTLPAGTYVLGAVLRLPPSATVLSGELSASTSMRRPYLDAFRLSRPRTRHPEPFAVPIAVRERGRPAIEAREPAADETPEGTGSRRLCVAADAESYSSRDVRGQLDVQRRLVEVLEAATRYAGLDRNLWTTQPQGDGELALLPLGLDEPRAVADLLRELAVALRRLNRGLVPQARLRLRVAVHTGMVYPGRNGFAGSAVVQVCRLRDSDDLRRTLREAASADLGSRCPSRSTRSCGSFLGPGPGPIRPGEPGHCGEEVPGRDVAGPGRGGLITPTGDMSRVGPDQYRAVSAVPGGRPGGRCR